MEGTESFPTRLRTTLHHFLSHPLTVPMVQDTDEQEPLPPDDYLLGRLCWYTFVECPLSPLPAHESRCSITVFDGRDFGIRSHYLRSSLGRPAMITSIRQTLERVNLGNG